MKALILTLVFCLGIIIPSLGQKLEQESQQTPQELYEFHMDKRNSINTAGWITFGGGLGMVIGASALALNSSGEYGSLAIVGCGLTISSIYLFTRARMHKKKANIQLHNGVIGLNNEFKYSGISIAFKF